MRKRKPEWLKVKYRNTDEVMAVQKLLNSMSLHTVCQEASCPNLLECFGRKTATFMILGKYCTRNCRFCNVESQRPELIDPSEPENVAKAIRELQLNHAVITMVTRDDLPDGGAAHIGQVIETIREYNPHVIIEVLISDLKGDIAALKQVLAAKPNILNHNVETVPRLYDTVRPQAIYSRSIKLLQRVKVIDPQMLTKSGIMVGLGETATEVEAVLKDLTKIGCDFLTIGQYLAPSKEHLPVVEYITPATFAEYKQLGLDLGFKHVASGPLVRSSYHAEQVSEIVKDHTR